MLLVLLLLILRSCLWYLVLQRWFLVAAIEVAASSHILLHIYYVTILKLLMFKDLSGNLELNKVKFKIRGGLLGILVNGILLRDTAEDSAEAMVSAEEVFLRK